jgi:hypothetical protein
MISRRRYGILHIPWRTFPTNRGVPCLQTNRSRVFYSLSTEGNSDRRGLHQEGASRAQGDQDGRAAQRGCAIQGRDRVLRSAGNALRKCTSVSDTFKRRSCGRHWTQGRSRSDGLRSLTCWQGPSKSGDAANLPFTRIRANCARWTGPPQGWSFQVGLLPANAWKSRPLAVHDRRSMPSTARTWQRVGNFRWDLSGRMNVVPVSIPVPREPIEDLRGLSRFLVAKIAKFQVREPTFNDSAPWKCL